MIESIMEFACTHAHHAHWFFFILLLLAGINVPISEDVILILSGAIAGTCIPDQAWRLFFWILAGCLISAWEAYSIGRFFGPKLYQFSWFKKWMSPEKIKRLHTYYEKFGILTFIVGRFCPCGVRNALFMTAGLGKMPFRTFLWRDTVACLLSASTLFYIGYELGENHQIVIHYLHRYQYLFLFFVFIVFVGAICYHKRKKANRGNHHSL